MYVHRKNMKNKQKEWHRATKPLKPLKIYLERKCQLRRSPQTNKIVPQKMTDRVPDCQSQVGNSYPVNFMQQVLFEKALHTLISSIILDS
jgi:hypothetical protein